MNRSSRVLGFGLGIALFASGCVRNPTLALTGPSNASPPSAVTPPVLSVPIVDLSGAYDPVTRRLASLNCNSVFPNDPNDRWCFNAFGGGPSGRRSPSYDYKVAAGVVVVAATAGTVSRVEAETNPLYPGEFEVETRSSPASSWLVIYDHVRDLRVALGSSVEPGAVLGIAGIHTSDPKVYGRVELQINQVLDPATRRSISICPQTLGTGPFNLLNLTALGAHNAANPAFAYASACLTPTVP